jgi:hypothetical protein
MSGISDGDKENVSTAPSAPADVGYKRPPVEHRFKKGVSGNPKGRPKKSERSWSHRQRDQDTLLEANTLVSVRKNGKTELVPMERLIKRQLFTKAANGDLKAIKMAIPEIHRSQSSHQNRNSRLFRELDQIEDQFEEACEIFDETSAKENRNEWRKKTTKI